MSNSRCPAFSADNRAGVISTFSYSRPRVNRLASGNAASTRSLCTLRGEDIIEERPLAWNGYARQQRQNAITGELIDIVFWFREALRRESEPICGPVE